MGNITTPATGLVAFESDTNQLLLYNGTTWVILG